MYHYIHIIIKINEVILHERKLVMDFVVLKRSNLKRNIIIGILVVGIISVVVLQFTRAKYRNTQSIPLVNGTINYTLADLNIVAITIDGEESDTLPEGNYELLDTSYCTIDGEDANLTINWNTETQALSITPFTTKGTKCYLDFEEVISVSDTLLANYPMQLTRNDFSITVTNTTTGTIYYEDTSKGRTYYFAGNPTDNWVSFGGFYWRIIRINEDGTVRMIYQGTSANTTGTSTQIQTSDFNSTANNNMYVGYMYESNQVHGLTSSSTIKGILDEWYQNNLTGVSNKIDGNVGFCGDREPSTSETTSNGQGGTGTTITYYGAYIRLTQSNNVNPTFECPNSSDLYTISGSSQGNKALTYPIGLITADEVAYAGGVYASSNQGYYLYTNQEYWTMSPSYINKLGQKTFLGCIFFVRAGGNLNASSVNGTYSVRPVINLKADVTISSGNGRSTSPYVIS